MNDADRPPVSAPAPARRNDALGRRWTLAFLLVVSAVALYLCWIMARPFTKPFLFAAVLAIIFYPLHARIQTKVRGPNTAALLSTLVVLLVVMIPTVGLGGVLARDIGQAYQRLSEAIAAAGGWVAYVMRRLEKPLGWLGGHVDLGKLDVGTETRNRLRELSAWMVRSIAGVLENLTSLIFDAAIAFFTLFFLFREGRHIRVTLAAALPLEPDRVERLFIDINDIVVANLYGVLAVAVVQGSLMAVAFWFLGLHSPILWGVVTAACSLVPVVGTGLVWLPAALFLMVSGHWVKGLIMLAWGAGFVSVIDQIVRPYVVGGRARMNTLLVFFSLLGGIEAFGILGIFVGPLVLSITLALLGMLREEARAWQLAAGGSGQSAAATRLQEAGGAPAGKAD
jgi:predicted PurR-regulated permease PerM